MDRPLRITCLRARTSDRTDGAGAAPRRLRGRSAAAWSARPRPARRVTGRRTCRTPVRCSRRRRPRSSAALDQGELPLLTASDCTICIATLPTAARRVPGLQMVWFDAHGDFNTPDSTPSGFLGGMCLAAACGRWDAGWPDTIDPAAVSFVGVRDLDPGERVEVERAGRRRGGAGRRAGVRAPRRRRARPVGAQAQFPVPGGLQPDEIRAVLARLRGEGRLVGIEVTALEDPAAVDLVTEILEPVTR